MLTEYRQISAKLNPVNSTQKEQEIMEYKDYYKTLGVAKSASESEIKTAYRKLARKYHPDMNHEKGAEDKFKELNEAYQVLSDPEKRKKYDQFGSEYKQYKSTGGNPQDFWGRWATEQQGQPQGNYRTVTQEELNEMFGGSGGFGGGGGFSDFFESLFGGGMGTTQTGRTSTRRTRRTQQAPLSRDVQHELEISLADAYRGSSCTLQFENGRKIEASIPAGVDTGSRVRLGGQADGADLYLHIKVRPDPNFIREGKDLRTHIPVDLYTAILGGEVAVPTPGKAVRLTIPGGTDSGKTFRLKGLGMPALKAGGEPGNLYAIVDIHIPEHLTDAEKQKFREIRNMRHAD